MRNNAHIDTSGDSLAFYSPYDTNALAEFKAAVPGWDRRWDAAKKCWLVAPQHLAAIERLCDRYNWPVTKNIHSVTAPPVVQRLLKVEYIGAPKKREDGSFSAYGYTGGTWSVVFPQDILRSWFELGDQATPQPTVAITYYGALGVKRDATPDEVKKAYRSMAKRWHPDVNRDPDAADMFKRIGLAYEVLSDPVKRLRYDAGLTLEVSVNCRDVPLSPLLSNYYWRPPQRCGWILVEGIERLGRVVVSKIMQWQDILDTRGRILVTSWPMGQDHFLETWIEQ